MRTQVASFLTAAACALALAGCSEAPQVASYENGKYQGKRDTRPWEGPVYNGDRVAWERDMKTRVRGQNEYLRVE